MFVTVENRTVRSSDTRVQIEASQDTLTETDEIICHWVADL